MPTHRPVDLSRRQLLQASLAGALVSWGCRWPEAPASPHTRETMTRAAVFYSPDYRVRFFGLERLHPFDIGKYDRIADALVQSGRLTREQLVAPPELPPAAFAAVHDAAYLDALRDASHLAGVLEVALPAFTPAWLLERKVLRPMRLASSGTVEAARAALDCGLGINLGGGYHHARPDLGHGFCAYNDVALAVHRLRSEGFTGQVLVLDTDAHQGDGNHAAFRDDPSVTTFSMHQGDAFPTPKVPGDRDDPLPRGIGDDAFLRRLGAAVDALLTEVQPALIVHVAGADVLHDDPLTDLGLTIGGLVARDRLVQDRARQAGVPLTYLLAGGYGPSAAEAQRASIEAMLDVHGVGAG